MEAEAAFREKFGGTENFMTPSVLRRYNTADFHVELSFSNDRFCGTWIYGLTVLERGSLRDDPHQSGSFVDLSELKQKMLDLGTSGDLVDHLIQKLPSDT